MRVLKWIGFLILAVLLIALIGVALNWASVKRLSKTLSLFNADKIVRNFSNMEEAFLHHDLNIGSPEPWQEEIRTLPETVFLKGKEHRLSDVLEELDTTALVIIQDGKLIHESYYQGTARDDLRISWSVAKSFMSGLYGGPINEGLIDISKPVDHYVSDLKGSAYEGCLLYTSPSPRDS